jgi:hypothetical protein
MLGLLAVFAIFVIVTGRHNMRALHNPNDLVSNTWENIVRASIVIPLVIGMFVGAPLLAQEYENNTDELLWTQGISRRKWLSIKLGWLLGAVALYGLAYSLLVMRWWRGAAAQLPPHFDPLQFDIAGLMPVVYAMFALVLGAAIGAWRRQTLTALAITIFAFVAIQFVVATYVRPHYAKPVAYVNKVDDCVTTHGPDFSSSTFCQDDKTAGYQAAQSPDNWILSFGTNNNVTTYQPAYRYWDFQRIEAGIYIGLTAIVVAAIYGMVLKRDA